MMFSIQAGFVTTAISLLTFGILGWFVQTSQFRLLNSLATPAQTSDWFRASATTLLISITIIIGLRQLQITFTEAQKKADHTCTIWNWKEAPRRSCGSENSTIESGE